MAEATLLWLRNDLRIADNPALAAALQREGPVTALYIEETDATLRPRGAASRWWLGRSLAALAIDLGRLGVALQVERGPAEKTLFQQLVRTGAAALFWNRRYAPAEREIDAAIKTRCTRAGIIAQSFPGNVLIEPFDLATKAGGAFAVFTPFWKTLKVRHIPLPTPAPTVGHASVTNSEPVAMFAPEPAWAGKLAPHWHIGEAAAARLLHAFLKDRVVAYPDGRDVPGRAATSKLSPHLAFGEISPRQVWHTAMALAHHGPDTADAVDKFLSELAWRDFNYHQLYHRDDIATVPMQPRFAGLAWRHAPADLAAWQQGRTGLPLIDAGMRELWQTGFMQNRVRMLTASLLAKNLLIDWRLGEAWFWDCLVDADGASNPGNWQWVAGSGLDAAPYFRIFNPVLQGERFDADGRYVRQFVPELASLPDAWLHQPWAAPAEVLAGAGITLGATYPAPIADLKASRQRALDALANL